MAANFVDKQPPIDPRAMNSLDAYYLWQTLPFVEGRKVPFWTWQTDNKIIIDDRVACRGLKGMDFGTTENPRGS